MQNHRAVEAIYSATYVEDYMDAVDNLPDEIQRQLTRMRELDIRYQSQLADVNASMKKLLTINNKPNRNEEEEKNLTTTKNKIQRLLMNIQEIGDDKIQIGQHIQDYTENRLRQLELDKKTLDLTNRSEAHAQESMMQHHSAPRDSSKEGASEGRAPKRARRARLDPSMSLNGPTSAKATSSNTHHNAVIEKRTEIQPPSTSVSTPVAAPEPGPSVSTPAASTPIAVSTVTTTPSPAVASTSTPAPKATRTPGAVTGRRDSEASTSGSAATTPYSKKQSVESSSGATSSEPPERERKESVTTRTPKKQYNQQKQKAAEKRAAVAAATKKKRTRQMEIDDSPPANLPVDPDEPTYCLCDQVSYGDMIGCDNDLCPLEWFHFNCVNLSMKPKGKWFCPKCRGDRQNVMKPRAQFMKELEKYNREKEEKP